MNESQSASSAVVPGLPQLDLLLKVSRGALIFRGVIFLLLGALMLWAPVAAMTAVTIVLGVFIVFEAGALLAAAWDAKGNPARPLLLTSAILLLILGLFAVIAPLWTDGILVIMVGIWELMAGFQCLIFSGSAAGGRWSGILSGILSILIGIFLVGAPLFGLVVFGMIGAILCFVTGVMMLSFGMVLKPGAR